MFGLFKKDKKEEAHSGPRYYDLKVREIVQETKDAITIVFDQPATKLSYKPGQFLTLIVSIGGKEVRRSYSLCSSPHLDENIRL